MSQRVRLPNLEDAVDVHQHRLALGLACRAIRALSRNPRVFMRLRRVAVDTVGRFAELHGLEVERVRREGVQLPDRNRRSASKDRSSAAISTCSSTVWA